MDALQIGGIDLERIQFGLITHALNSHLLTEDADGFLGLGPQASRTNFERTFMDYMADQKLFGCRRFGFIFNNGVEGAGYIAFGNDVETHIKGELVFVDSTSVTNWQTELTKIMVGEHTVYVGARATLFDTLYKSVVLPSEVAKKINELLEPTGSVGPFTVMDCEMKQGLPDITFAFGSTQLVLKSHQYLARIEKDGRDYCVNIFAEADPTAFPSAIMGMSFISKFDTLFDLDLMRIGFASLGR
ncbi:hypothetical protein T265_03432 [Opisthorchis viverrini]|uniref:Peptidase A1 domain-containing protein n=1 Tax=Opisthorchis viverrini TaxID=6198 RepID=A0A075AHK8_OPIVI|nr:hypothetical protein T265_03432 [Opisthorchis viverrini]KER30059.1 hypothetical protein T265_03432 [Opisthorchis viverrini]